MSKYKARLKCPYCNTNSVYLEKKYSKINYKGKEIEYLDEYYMCSRCLEEFYDSDTLDKALNRIREKGI